MELGFTAEQEILRESAREFLDRECPMDEVRKTLKPETRFPETLWTQVAELGWFGLTIPEKWGGSGLGSLDVAILQEELGRSLCPVPFLSTAVLGAQALIEAGSRDQCERFLPELAQGRIRIALAQLEADADWGPSGIQMAATAAGDHYQISGVKTFVPDGPHADFLLVPVRVTPSPASPDSGITLLLVETSTPGVRIRPIAFNEPSRPVAEITFDGVQVPLANRLGAEGQAWPLLASLHTHGRVALCAELCGAAEKVLALSVDYAKSREQFGQPIGRFQAIQHKCADMLVKSEGIRSAAYYAAWSLQEAEPDIASTACLAKAYSAEAYSDIAGAGIQIHGGLGFTWEQDLHLYFKHAQAADFAWGDRAHHLALAADRLFQTEGHDLSEAGRAPDSQ